MQKYILVIDRLTYPALPDNVPRALGSLPRHLQSPADRRASIQHSVLPYFLLGARVLLCLGWERSMAFGQAARRARSEQGSPSFVLRSPLAASPEPDSLSELRG